MEAPALAAQLRATPFEIRVGKDARHDGNGDARLHPHRREASGEIFFFHCRNRNGQRPAGADPLAFSGRVWHGGANPDGVPG